MFMNVLDLGRCQYEEAFEIQMELVEKVQTGQVRDTLILVEHPPVITLGRNADQQNILLPSASLQDLGISLQQTNRGGDVTYHGPGQLVGYPIFHLKQRHGGSIRTFVHHMESVFIHLLDENWGIRADRDPINAGVWVGHEKIVALGLAVKRGVTMHGFAFNVCPELSHYQAIVPCGLADRGVTSLEKLIGVPIEMNEIKAKVRAGFVKEFGFQ